MHSSKLTLAVASIAIAMVFPALAQQPNEHRAAPGGAHQAAPHAAPGQLHPGQPHGPGGMAQPGQVHAGPPGGPGQFHGPGAAGPHGMHAVGEHGYSFHGGFHGRRDIATFNERERAVWNGGLWRHEVHGGRLGYWWVVNGSWYFYDRPFTGPPLYVSEVELIDEAGLPVVAPGPVVVAPAPIVVAPAPVVVAPPPVVCVGPLCVR